MLYAAMPTPWLGRLLRKVKGLIRPRLGLIGFNNGTLCSVVVEVNRENSLYPNEHTGHKSNANLTRFSET
ncbi:hypothetical protein BH20ACI2_BH20ACI2_11520 [soil metagenome]